MVIPVDAAGAFNAHYGAGQGDHQDEENTIPPFTYQGRENHQNWDAEGQAIVENDCVTQNSEPELPGEPAEDLPNTGTGPMSGTGAEFLAMSASLLAVVAGLGGLGVMLSEKRH